MAVAVFILIYLFLMGWLYKWIALLGLIFSIWILTLKCYSSAAIFLFFPKKSGYTCYFCVTQEALCVCMCMCMHVCVGKKRENCASPRERGTGQCKPCSTNSEWASTHTNMQLFLSGPLVVQQPVDHPQPQKNLWTGQNLSLQWIPVTYIPSAASC